MVCVFWSSVMNLMISDNYYITKKARVFQCKAIHRFEVRRDFQSTLNDRENECKLKINANASIDIFG